MRILIAIAIGLAIWWIATRIIIMLATEPESPDPADVSETIEHYRCSTCGMELTLTVRSNTETAPPRHCRDEMTLVWRPDQLAEP